MLVWTAGMVSGRADWTQAGATGHRQCRLMTGKAGLGQAILDGADYRNDKVVARAGYKACS